MTYPSWNNSTPPRASMPQPIPGGYASGAPVVTQRPRVPAATRAWHAAQVAIGYLVVLWVIYAVQVLAGQQALRFGVHPLDVSSLPDIFTAPFLHGSVGHLVSNSVPGAVFAFLLAWSGRKEFVWATLLIIVLSGLGVWLIGGPMSVHIGASGVLYGWLAYLVVRGFFSRSFGQLALGIALALSYTGWLWGVVPSTPGVSWQYHLCGALAGVLAAWVLSSRAREDARQRQLAR
ncbi:rhomboid family intramembrane serine protease [Corynebacterium sp. 13CS0277]|uniref:rhomboid family intramembrane serine protease n=1 Tax=Corynebacterium sp. 13CS0277 TaxID=2071994 RepID=UPI000D03AD4A|nr:rhomboid family intramembrane serine protease [Corynebacterium sp. 13CS0277]PRQ10841.1 rhomboid family intramembrane serine protease [Corynebacterium sp. 13CS0277]